MSPVAFLTGRIIDAAAAVVPVYDAGFMQGTTVAEQLRTFNGRLFRLDDHLERLAESLAIIGVEPGISRDELAAAAERVVGHNYRLLPPGHDLGLSTFVTPGPYPTLAPPDAAGPTVCIHSYPLPFHYWADKYIHGESLVISDVRQVSPRSWPPRLKCRSRMHYYLADRQARQIDPQGRALLLDENGFVCEASTANVVLYRQGEGIVSPRGEKILQGISLAVLAELAASQTIAWTQRDLTPAELTLADEVLLCSTSLCVVPVVRVATLDGQITLIGNGQPGAIFKRLLAAWSELVGLDIEAQAITRPQ